MEELLEKHAALIERSAFLAREIDIQKAVQKQISSLTGSSDESDDAKTTASAAAALCGLETKDNRCAVCADLPATNASWFEELVALNCEKEQYRCSCDSSADPTVVGTILAMQWLRWHASRGDTPLRLTKSELKDQLKHEISLLPPNGPPSAVSVVLRLFPVERNDALNALVLYIIGTANPPKTQGWRLRSDAGWVVETKWVQYLDAIESSLDMDDECAQWLVLWLRYVWVHLNPDLNIGAFVASAPRLLQRPAVLRALVSLPDIDKHGDKFLSAVLASWTPARIWALGLGGIDWPAMPDTKPANARFALLERFIVNSLVAKTAPTTTPTAATHSGFRQFLDWPGVGDDDELRSGKHKVEYVGDSFFDGSWANGEWVGDGIASMNGGEFTVAGSWRRTGVPSDKEMTVIEREGAKYVGGFNELWEFDGDGRVTWGSSVDIQGRWANGVLVDGTLTTDATKVEFKNGEPSPKIPWPPDTDSSIMNAIRQK